MTTTLYELTEEIRTLLGMLEDEESDIDVIMDTLEAVEGEFEAKADNYAKLMRTLKADSEAVDKEIKRLQKRKQRFENAQERLKMALEQNMIFAGKEQFKTTFFSFKIAKNPPSVQIIGDVPSDFLIEQEPKVDKVALKNFLKENGNTDYAQLVQTEGLRIN